MDKVQRIREEVERLKSQLLRSACSSQIAMETICKEEAYNEVLALLDSLQEEPVNVWHNTIKETPTQGSNILMVRKEEKDTNYPPIAGCFHGTNSRFDGRNWGYYDGFCYNEIEPPLKWAYIDELLNLDNPCNIGKNLQEPQVKESLEFQHNDEMCEENGNSLTKELVSEDLEIFAQKESEAFAEREYEINYIDRNALVKGYYWGCIDGAKWWKEQMMTKTVDGIARPDDNEVWCDLKPFNFKDGDKVKVIVIKED